MNDFAAEAECEYPIDENGYWHVDERRTASTSYKRPPRLPMMPRISKGQLLLREVVHSLYPKAEIKINHPHPRMRHGNRRPMELDLWLPRKRLAFEYQGIQHFRAGSSFEAQAKLRMIQAADEDKLEACRVRRIALVVVDYTWKGDEDTIRKLITKARQDVPRRYF